jgi:hypothetical protein
MRSQTGYLGAPLVVVALLLATGCSVANPFAQGNASAKRDAEQMALKWAQCMRQHGVDVSDPVFNGNGITIRDPGSGGENQGPAPEIQAAKTACKKYQLNGGQASSGPSQEDLDAATKFTQCMRDHGIPMQDPKVENGDLSMGANPDRTVDTKWDQFRQAQKACQHYLPGAAGGGA